mmetsp:Transcript_13524/g.29876  ORF Transcript_13524/g.29876 Transcript_13524/m.29876 type:complete len:546 (-) Transcript_13524:69-1706(-)
MSEVYIKEPSTNGKAIFRTTHGDLEIELWATECPKACRNFCQLILEGFYDNTIFHKVIKDFLVQGGDRTGTGNESESIYGKPYPDEIHPRLKYRYRGMMGVASAGKGTNTNGSQFFILMDRAPALDGKYTLFGKVVGQTVYNLARISEVECDKKDRPIDPPRITRAELVNDPFGDLDPRRHREPPKVQVAEEPKRRAAVQNKKMLSFGDEDEDDDFSDDEKEKTPAAASNKLKSAHDVLQDPRLMKEMAYPDAAAERGAKRQIDEQPAPSTSSIAKRVAVAAATAASASKQKKAEMIAAAAARSESESDSDEDSDDSDASGGAGGVADISKQKSLKRQEEILALKKGIAEVGNERKEEKKSKKFSSALAELRAGYQPREKRKHATGRENKRREAQEITDTMKAFRNRLNALSSMPAGDSSEEEKEKKEKKEKDKKEKKSKKDKKGKDDDEPEEGTFASIWKEGEEDADDDWLAGGGLKFHVTADKAFKLDRDRAFKTLDIFDPLAKEGNAEVLAHARKKHSEGAIPLRRKGPPKKEERGDRERDR